MPSPLWIVVANGSRARVLQRHAPAEGLTELRAWVHPATRQHHQDFGNRQSGIRGRSGLAERSPVQDRERHAFAHEVCDFLVQAVHRGDVDRIALFSSSPFLGELLTQSQGTLGPHLCARHAVDLTHLSLTDLSVRLLEDYRL